jgi:tetratricopeptide (TPR) repeat protein
MRWNRGFTCVSQVRKRVLMGAIATAAAAASISAQQQGNSQYSPRFGMGHLPDATVVHGSDVESSAIADDARCFPWKLSEVRAGTVDVQTLNIPSSTKREYQKACDASKKNRYDEVEQHSRAAIEKIEKYPAAWVMLGLSLAEQKKLDDAQDACARAMKADPAYLPAYLCSAEISTRKAQWKQVLTASNMAISLNLGGDSYAFYYRASAYLHLNNLDEAKKNALQAGQIDVNHSEPSIDLLMALIYEREGDKAQAIAQLQQILKRRPDRQTADEANQRLAALESQKPAGAQ